jgi:hypothetical protein
MAILGVDDFKSKLRGGGARPNLFKATINFPAYAQGDVEITSFLCSSASLPASTVGGFRLYHSVVDKLKWLGIGPLITGQLPLSMTLILKSVILWNVG